MVDTYLGIIASSCSNALTCSAGTSGGTRRSNARYTEPAPRHRGGVPPIRHAVDVGDRRIAQCIVEIASGPGIEVWEPKVDQNVTAVA